MNVKYLAVARLPICHKVSYPEGLHQYPPSLLLHFCGEAFQLNSSFSLHYIIAFFLLVIWIIVTMIILHDKDLVSINLQYFLKYLPLFLLYPLTLKALT